MRFKIVILGMLIVSSSFFSHAQRIKEGTIRGIVLDERNEPLVGSSVVVKGTEKGVLTDTNGAYSINNLSPGNYQIEASFIGFRKVVKTLTVKNGDPIKLDFVLPEQLSELGEVTIIGNAETVEIREKGFNVEAIETRQLKAQSIDINRVLDRSAGVRIRRSGGMGSDFIYSLDGMSGQSIRFFVDGIPMDYFGSSYSINNFPTSLVDRIDIYKGVVPIDLGSDALGGAINLVTNKDIVNFLEASYSYGSFNTHQATVQGQWTTPESGFTAKLSTFYNYSDNNYKVWGRGVTYANEETDFRPVTFTKENPATRFNDNFRTVNAKLDLGFTNKPWADQVFVGAVVSDLERGIQHGQTMAVVYGDVKYKEDFLMPFLTYRKDNLLTDGLNTDFFISLAMKEGITVDTSTFRYDWSGEIVNSNPNGGEINPNSRSEFTLEEDAYVGRWNTTYSLRDNHKLGMNFTYTNVERNGKDPFQPWFRIPLLEPQSLRTLFGGLSYESKLFNDRLNTSIFIKYYGYKASINEDVLIAIDGEQQTIARAIENDQSNWGGGFASSFKVTPQIRVKLSVEQATRMPSAEEALGDGITIQNAPNIKPEQSFNINAGLTLGKYYKGDHSFKAGITGFYRDTDDQLLFTVTDNQGNGQFQNISKTLGKGVEVDLKYGFKEFLEFTANATYLDIRNNQAFDETANQPNIVYKDRLRNTPYLMANAGFRFKFHHIIQKDARAFAYVQTGYVHEYFLGWPSLGTASLKNTIPSQLVHDLGFSYSFPRENLSLGFDISNITNQQVYDNFLLQKPGRAFFVKITYSITAN
ncbi:TonB-dependent receptor [Fulvivirgaceae bacterium BMA12]|uniref:TonB-dependent receptor n=1 Tax=Agaribacillus aureus TaxID=3051825 RepID=A0ABT8LLJ9_9BACT|nr:TonB-dependent receptor [Fulvivirgaceae bacterium BMA12]